MQNRQLLTNETAEKIKKKTVAYISEGRASCRVKSHERREEIGKALSYSYSRKTSFYREVKGEK